MTFWGKNYDGFALRRIAAEVQQAVKQVDNVSETTLLGGQRRELKVTLDPQKLAAFHASPLLIARALQMNNQRLQAGSFAEGNQELAVEGGAFLHSAEEARSVVVSVLEWASNLLGRCRDGRGWTRGACGLCLFRNGRSIAIAITNLPGRHLGGGQAQGS